MKAIKYIQSLLTLLIVSLATQAQDFNELSVKDVNGMRGKTVSVPVYLTNTQEVAAVQFDITMPSGSQVYLDSTQVADNRRVDHIISGRNRGSNKYRFMFYSPTNQALLGNTGRLCNIVFKVYNGLDDTETYDFKLSNIVMSDLNGNPIEATSQDGHLTLQSYPDFEVSNLKVTQANMVPGGTMKLSWTVKNIGETASTGGWKENFYLTNESGTLVPVGSNPFENTGLAPGASVNRSIEVTLPQVLGIDGNVFAKVSIKGNSDSGERSEQEWNNSATAETGLNLTKQITLTMPAKAISEDYRYNVGCQIARSGNRNSEETFTLTCNKPERLEVPATVTIGRNAASANFYVKLKDNAIYNEDDSIVTITAKATGYEDATGQFVIEDNEYPQMTLTTSQQAVSEGETFQLTVTLPKTAKQDVLVNFTSDDAKRFDFPASATITKGQKKVSIDVTAIDNDKPELELTTAFYATAEKFEKALVMMVVEDNDMPELEMTFSPTTIAESAGLAAVKVQLVRKTLTDRDVTIQMSDDSENGEIYYAQKRFTMKAGVTTTEFAIGVVDNVQMEGNRTVNITAGVWATSCNCSATGSNIGAATIALTILDDDGPSLSVTSSSSSLLEGKENATTLTVRRNTGKSGSTTVTITSDRDDDLEYNHTVTIPDGQETASVSINAKKNSVADDERTVVFTATSNGFTQGTCWALITDQSLPDATVEPVALATDEVGAGEKADMTIIVNNIGNEPLPVQTTVNLYIGNDLLTTLYTMEPIAAGETGTITSPVQMPDVAGNYQLKAVVNEEKKVKELIYLNNTSANTPITLVASFAATAEVEKDVFTAYEDIDITGKAIGTNVSNRDVEIYLIHNGVRDTLLVTTDATGNFSTTYNPRGVAGHYDVGACYVGEGLTKAHDSFDVYGMKLTSNAFLKYEPSVGIPYEAKVNVSNMGALPLHNVRMEVVSMGDEIEVNQTPIATLDGNKQADLAFTLIGKAASNGNRWQQLSVKFTSDEGAEFDGIIYYYNRVATGKIRASISNIKTTMTKGQSRDYVFDITNVGQGETGKITLAMPDNAKWMVASTGKEMSSLATNDTTQIVLRLTPTDDLQLNVPQRGTIGINCENGEGMAMSFVIEPVSESTGRLIVDVCDEYTYYTEEKPHVKGAKVTVSHPTTGAVVATGVTGEDGQFIVPTLPEGYYTLYVTADKHESYRNNILVDPGVDNERIINLSYQAVTVTWNVVETTVEDEYEIVTTTTFETHVPKPVVTIRGPEKLDIDAMEVGSSQILYYTLTNEGLINALNTTFEVPTGLHEMKFEALANVGPFTLAPHQSVQIPVRATRFSDGSNPSGANRRAESAEMQQFRDCFAGFSAYYEVMCGKDMKNDRALVSLALRACLAGMLANISGTSGGSSVGNPGGGSGYYYTGGSYGSLDAKGDGLCDPDVTDAATTTINFLGGKAPGIGPLISQMTEAEDRAAKMAEGKLDAPDIIETGMNYGGPMLEASPVCKGPLVSTAANNPIVKTLKEYSGDLKSGFEIYQKWEKVRNKANVRNPQEMADALRATMTRRASTYSWFDAFANALYKYSEQVEAVVRLQEEFYGDSIWWAQPTFDPTIENFFQMLQKYDEYHTLIWHQAAEERWKISEIADKMVAYMEMGKPQSVTMEQMKALMMRIRYTAHGGSSENRMDLNKIRQEIEFINSLDNEAITNGYPSMAEWFFQAYEDFKKAYHEASSNSVCVNIKIEFKQKMVLTRQAFRGTLTVTNGNEEKPMKNVKLSLQVTDEDGNVATSHEFQIEPESIEGFTGELKGADGWELAPNANGTATILFIPTKYAAPTEDKLYNFGGSLTYTDPYTDLTVTRDLTPVTLTVKPSPNLDLTYFMQRDIWGDDAMTTDKVEPMEEAEFALLINNVGYGDATNVRMTTEQPKVVENEKGLLIDIELISSQLNGGYKTLALGGSVPTNFGNIPAHSTTYAQWWWQSSLLGHFTNYDVKATHLTSYGNEDLTLLNNVEIHELIRSLNTYDTATGKALKAWLVNDVTDFNDTPDMLYLSDGTTERVDLATGQTERKDATHYTLTVTPRANGWHYGNVTDPTLGRATIKHVVRNDGVVIDPRNVWQTDRTLRDGMDPLYEFRIHFADKILSNGADVSYEITFEPKPTNPLTVESVDGLPAKGEVSARAVGEMTIHFNKDVRDFKPENIRLECQGVKQTEEAVVQKVNAQTYKVNYPTATTQSGYFVMLVYTSKMTDTEGYNGEYDSQSIWTQFIDGQCKLTTIVTPEAAGTVTPTSGIIAYGETAHLAATPNEHYTFKQWSMGDEVLTTKANYDLYMDNNYMLYAEFVPRQYNVTLTYDEASGTVEGIGTSQYEYGTKLSITAKANKDYTFEGWQVNGKKVSTDATYELTISGATEVKPLFTYTPASVTITYNLVKGWNWIYVNPADQSTQWATLLAPIADKVQEVRSPSGIATTLSPDTCYQVLVTEDVTLDVATRIDNLANSVSLKKGWNWISYRPFETLDVNTALTNLSATEGHIVKGQDGFAIYDGTLWTGSLTEMHPGQGYQLYSPYSDTFTYPTTALTQSLTVETDYSTVMNANTRRAQVTTLPNQVDRRKFANNMCVIADVKKEDVVSNSEAYIIGAFAGDECRGISSLVNGKYFITIYGNGEESIDFDVFDSAKREYIESQGGITFSEKAAASVASPTEVLIDEEATGISSVTTTGIAKKGTYNLAGQRVDTTYKGIVIKDGKKILAK